MSSAIILLRMRIDVEKLPHAVRGKNPQWFVESAVRPEAWLVPLVADPVDVVDVMLTGECSPYLSHLWWSRYGFHILEADTLRMLAERSPSLESIIGSALIGNLWRSASYQIEPGGPSAALYSPADINKTRSCTEVLWQRLWSNRKVATRTPELRGLVAAHPSSLACLGAQDPSEAYYTQRNMQVHATVRRENLLRVLRQTFDFLPSVLQWIDSEHIGAVAAWHALWDQLEHQASDPLPLPILA